MKNFFKNSSKPLLIAEISGNHNGNKKRFLNLIESAFKNGADMVKIQTYEPQDITLKTKNKKFMIRRGIWSKEYLWQLYEKAHTPFSWHSDAFKIAKKFNRQLFSSPFSIRAVDLLEKFNVQFYKLASFEITDFKLIRYIAKKNKPILISTGISNIQEIKNAIKVVNKYHNKIIIMHCVSNYPTKLEDVNLSRINKLKKIFKNYKIGYSDHTDDIISSVAASVMNISVIEKHFNIDNKKTNDSDFSIKPKQLKALSKILNDLHTKKKIKNDQRSNFLNLKRSIFAIKDIKKNETINEKNIDTLRPKIGLCSSKYFKIIGKKSKKFIKSGSPIYKNYLN